ncbi:MAG: transposase [Peptococcaceae bacterium]|nr:transposase [Peptococcaceae bacterium]
MTDENQSRRKRWTAQRKMELVLESVKGQTSIAELCRQNGISQLTVPTIP